MEIFVGLDDHLVVQDKGAGYHGRLEEVLYKAVKGEAVVFKEWDLSVLSELAGNGGRHGADLGFHGMPLVKDHEGAHSGGYEQQKP